jgi:hypothetical protein
MTSYDNPSAKSPPWSGGFIRRFPPNKKTDKTGVPERRGG